ERETAASPLGGAEQGVEVGARQDAGARAEQRARRQLRERPPLPLDGDPGAAGASHPRAPEGRPATDAIRRSRTCDGSKPCSARAWAAASIRASDGTRPTISLPAIATPWRAASSRTLSNTTCRPVVR